MIGLGKWSCGLDTNLIRGKSLFEILDVNGSYQIKLMKTNYDLPDMEAFDFTENGNTLRFKAKTSLLPERHVSVSMTFDGDKMTGYIRMPIFGKLAFTNGERVL